MYHPYSPYQAPTVPGKCASCEHFMPDLADLAVFLVCRPQPQYHFDIHFRNDVNASNNNPQRCRGTMNEVYFDFQDYGVMRHINIAYPRDLKKAGCTNRASETARSMTRSVFSPDEATFLWPIDPKLTLRRREANQVIISGPPHTPTIWLGLDSGAI